MPGAQILEDFPGVLWLGAQILDDFPGVLWLGAEILDDFPGESLLCVHDTCDMFSMRMPRVLWRAQVVRVT